MPEEPTPSWNPDGYTPEAVLAGLSALAGASPDGSHFAADVSELVQRPENAWCLLVDVERAFDQLPLQQRRAVFLRLVVGLPETAAADRLGVSQQSVSRRLRAGLVHLFQALGIDRGHDGTKGGDAA